MLLFSTKWPVLLKLLSSHQNKQNYVFRQNMAATLLSSLLECFHVRYQLHIIKGFHVVRIR